MNLYFRLLGVFLKCFLLKKHTVDILDKQLLTSRVWLNDIDLNGHMNNGRYLTIMDLGRLQLVARLGLLDRIVKSRMLPVVAGANIVYLKSLPPFRTFILQTQVIYWDADWFYLRQDFVNKKNELCASALVKAAFLQHTKRIDSYQFLKGVTHTKKPKSPEYLQAFLAGEKAWLNHIKSERNTL